MTEDEHFFLFMSALIGREKRKIEVPGGFESVTFSFEGVTITAKPRLLLEI